MSSSMQFEIREMPLPKSVDLEWFTTFILGGTTSVWKKGGHKGGMRPTGFLVTQRSLRDGKAAQSMVIVSPTQLSHNGDKDAFSKLLQKMATDQEAIFFGIVVEAWLAVVANVEEEKRLLAKSLETEPGRLDCVVATIEESGVPGSNVHRAAITTADDGARTLGEFEKLPSTKMETGRFIGMLPVKPGTAEA